MKEGHAALLLRAPAKPRTYRIVVLERRGDRATGQLSRKLKVKRC
ncbi:MAG TPA: hypothetical protein VE570_15300 [Thermoleophilaceae bacterium]|nr:hypothetical protein [Thermoleophilaceae bacterium]